MQRDEIYLIDMYRIFVRERRWFVGGLVFVLACTFTFTHVVKPQWQATAWIQIGQVGQVLTGQDPKVEPLLRVIERLQLVPFENDIMKSIGYSATTPEAQLFRASLKMEPLPYEGPLVRLTVRGKSPQQARQFAEATVTQLRAVHRQIEAVPLALARARLDQAQADLASAVADRDRLVQTATSKDKDGTKSESNSGSLASVLLAKKDEEIRDLRQARDDLIARLSTTYTYETSMMWPVYVPDNQVFPNITLMWGIGFVLGACLGAFAAIARNAVRRRKQM